MNCFPRSIRRLNSKSFRLLLDAARANEHGLQPTEAGVDHEPPRLKSAVDGMLEVFNVFNHANRGNYVTDLTNAMYGQPTDDTGTVYRPRMLQLGFRATF